MRREEVEDEVALFLTLAGFRPVAVMPSHPIRALDERGPKSSTGYRRWGAISRSALTVPDAVHQLQVGLPQCLW